MSESLKSAVISAILRLLEPIVRLLIEAGVGIGDFQTMARKVYVEVARAQVQEPEPNISRISAVTGIGRSAVAELLATPASSPPRAERGRHRAEHILHGWWNDPEFRGPDGQPALLPLRGAKRSFATLVKRYSGDPRVVTILEELVKVKAVHRRPDGKLEALSRTFVTARWDVEGVLTVGERVRDLLNTLLHNIKHPHMPRYERFVLSERVAPKYVPLVLRDIAERSDITADAFQDLLTDPTHCVRAGRHRQDARRIGVVIYVIDEPSTVEPLAPSPTRPRGTK